MCSFTQNKTASDAFGGVVQSGANKKIKTESLKFKLNVPDAVQLLTVNRVEAVTQIRGKTPLVSGSKKRRRLELNKSSTEKKPLLFFQESIRRTKMKNGIPHLLIPCCWSQGCITRKTTISSLKPGNGSRCSYNEKISLMLM